MTAPTIKYVKDGQEDSAMILPGTTLRSFLTTMLGISTENVLVTINGEEASCTQELMDGDRVQISKLRAGSGFWF